jgi:chaperonin GroES
MNSNQAANSMPGAVPGQDTEIPGLAQDQTGDGTAELNAAFLSANMAIGLDKDKLDKISDRCKRGFEDDLMSRSDWESEIDEWTALAKQTRETKSFPWPNASNVKYPLLSTAAMQFAARAYPSLLPSSGRVVNAVVVGKDPDGSKLEKATNVSTYMSYQFLYQMESWEEGMDKMLMMLPIVGTMFKKTWYDKSTDQIRSEVILPKNIVVNNWAKSLHSVERISEIIEMPKRLLVEKQRMGVYRDVDLADAALPEGMDGVQDETTPYQLIEQHTFYDMDGDDYEEPVIVTFERVSGEILSIYPRFAKDDVIPKPGGKGIGRIKPRQMYTKFGFVPNPDGSFYDIGFGVLLGPLNEAVNSVINQLIDSGTVSALQSGFIGKSLRIKMGDARMQPGEWRPVNATGDDLRKQIVPLPAKDPSTTLFQLMGSLITSGKELASVAEIFVGKMPGQNTPATTTMASIEQGMKVFTAVYKRLFRSLSEEFDKVFDLNHMYLDQQTYVNVLDIEVDPSDFDRSKCDIEPGADPTAVSQTEKLLKAQGLMELLQTGVLDTVEVVRRILEAQEQPNADKLFNQQVQQTGQFQPPPDPKILALQLKQQSEQQKAALDSQAQQQDLELQGRSAQQKMMQAQQQHQLDMTQKAQSADLEARVKMQMENVKIAAAKASANQQGQAAQQQLVHKQQEHQVKLQHAKEISKSQPKK